MCQADNPLTTTTSIAAATSAPSRPITKVVHQPLSSKPFGFRETTSSEVTGWEDSDTRLAILGESDAHQR
jgi:hypothetical protein